MRTPADGMRCKTESRPIDGMLLIDKPAGITSHDVVSEARRALRTRRIGHAGTLDPFATGLLVLLVGHATRLLPHLDGEPKVYDATIVFGSETDTDDLTGTVVRTAEFPDPARVREAIVSLTGTIEQVPPAYSAKQVDGQRAYAAARRGAALELDAVRVDVHGWDLRELTDDHLRATITCGGGTYIRALARDLGRLSGSAAHLGALRRVRSGSFHVADAIPLETLRAGGTSARPAIDALPHLPAVALSDDDVSHVRQGRLVAAPGEATPASVAALVDSSGRLVAVAIRTADAWQPRVVLPAA
jgi:tRNA pseudouridine55 synthase